MGNKDFWKNRWVLVTGGAGFVGGHLVGALLDRGAQVIVLYRDLDSRSYFADQGFDKKVVMASCDVKDYWRVFDVVTRYAVEFVFHLAAQPLVTTAYQNPRETFMTNIGGTINVLEACRQAGGVRGVIVASSDKAYGRSEQLPYVESYPLQGDHPYSSSKSSADLIAMTYARTYGLPVVITRFGNIYGPGDLNLNRIIPGSIMAALQNQILEIRSDGQMIREYVSVNDVVYGYLLLAENIERSKGEAFNFGSQDRYSVLEIVKKINTACSTKIEVKILNMAKNEIEDQRLNYEKIHRLLGWEPKHKLDAALPETIEWYKKFNK